MKGPCGRTDGAGADLPSGPGRHPGRAGGTARPGEPLPTPDALAPALLPAAAAAVHALYAQVGAAAVPAPEFLPRALTALAPHVGFDLALAAGIDPSGAMLRGVRTLDSRGAAPPGLAARTARADALRGAALETPGRAVRETVAATGSTPALHALAIVSGDPDTGLLRFVGLYREGAPRAFTASEAGWLEFLAPHLALASRMHLSAVGLRLAPSVPGTASGGVALCDAQGAFLEVEKGFLAPLRDEHPRWPGGWLPAPYRTLLEGSEPREVTGRTLVVRRLGGAAPYLLQLRRLVAADRLSATQRLVAEQLAAGCSHHEIAARLAISATTVRNHAAAIYRRLGVRNRAQLVNAVRAAGRAVCDGPVPRAEPAAEATGSIGVGARMYADRAPG